MVNAIVTSVDTARKAKLTVPLLGFQAKKRPADEAVSTPLSTSDEPDDEVGTARGAAEDAGGEPPRWRRWLPALSPADRPLSGGMGAIEPPPPRVSRARPGALHAPRPRARQPRGPAGEDDHDSATRTATIPTDTSGGDTAQQRRRRRDGRHGSSERGGGISGGNLRRKAFSQGECLRPHPHHNTRSNSAGTLSCAIPSARDAGIHCFQRLPSGRDHSRQGVKDTSPSRYIRSCCVTLPRHERNKPTGC